MKMAILLKAIYRFSRISTEITTQFFTEIEKSAFNFVWKHTHTHTHTHPKIAETIPNNKRTEILLPLVSSCITELS